ncbi:hypothetical protein H2201_008237 [Coniosporium apollinis]|uniref:Uncharacterized protein n=1 Tax=Coniosporium apollinis TaxID=61459 RepID=A0ABQ9NJ76_9PEZI|nr:hypothetical protein H2201_008237 [Coniosporium apollinis]
MPALWEEFPHIGRPLGAAVDFATNGVLGVVVLSGQGANALADIAIGKERKERIVTEGPTWFLGNVSDKDKIISSAKEILQKAGRDSVRDLFAAVLDLICPVVELMDPRPLLESLLKGGKCVINRISHIHTEETRRFLGDVLQGSLDLAVPALDLINPESVLESASKLIALISPQIKRPAIKQVDEVIQRSLDLLASATEFINPDLLLATMVKLSKTVLNAVLVKVGQLNVIKGGIFSNDLNAATLGLVWSNGAEFARFVVDLAECIKCYATAISLDGRDGRNDPTGRTMNSTSRKP